MHKTIKREGDSSQKPIPKIHCNVLSRNVALRTVQGLSDWLELISLNWLLDSICYDKKHREALLKQHPFDIYRGKDGRYRTYVKDETNGYGRRMIVKSHKEDLLDYLVNFYEKQEKDTSIRDYTLERIYPD